MMSSERIKHFISCFQNQNPRSAAETVFRSILNNEVDPAYKQIQYTLSALSMTIQNIDPTKYQSKELMKYIYKLLTVNCHTIKAAICYKEQQLLKYEEPLMIGILENVSKKLSPKIYNLYQIRNKEKDHQFQEFQTKFSQMNLRKLLNINEKHFPYTNMYDTAMNMLNMVEKSTSATTMLNRLIDVQKEISHALEQVYGEIPLSFDADSLLEILQFLILRSKIQHPFAVCEFIESHFTSKDYSTHFGFSLTTFNIAVESVLQITGVANPRCTVKNDNPLINTKIISTTQTPSLTLSLHFIVSNGLFDPQLVAKYMS